MANAFGTDILLQAADPRAAADFYVRELGFVVTDETPHLISLHGEHISLFIEKGPPLGPILEVLVEDVAAAKIRLIKAGCTVVKDEAHFPRCYIRDPMGLTYNLSRARRA